MARPHEYIGVSGVVNQEQQAELEEMFAEFGLRDQRALQLGIKATHKTQYLGVENKYGSEWYPVGAQAKNVLRRNALDDWVYRKDLMGVAQVCYDASEVYDRDYRRMFLFRMLGTSAIQTWLTGVQFDMLPDWCGHRMLAGLAKEVIEDDVAFLGDDSTYRPLTVTLQCQGDIMNAHTPSKIAETLTQFPHLDYVLFDASGGRGVRMNSETLLPYIEAVYDRPDLNHLDVAVGGGLNAEVVRAELPKILRHFPDVSWDAEGQLHPVNAEGKRPLDMTVCREYLEACAEVLC